jgi:type VII secretion protein EccCa/type VII secretion protein EccCb
MSKRPHLAQRVALARIPPVAVAPAAPMALPEREPRSWWMVIGVPALIVALIGTIVMLYVSGVRSLQTGFFPIMGVGALMTVMMSGRLGRARKISWGEMEKSRRSYLRELDRDRDEIQKAVVAQRRAQDIVHGDPQSLGSVIGGPRMWERQRSDPDFLDVRLGVGVQHAPESVLSVSWPQVAVAEELEPVTGQALRDFILEQRKIRDIAKVLNLLSKPGFSFVGEDLAAVRALLRSVLCSLAVFHAPRDVKLLVVTRNPELWSWMVWLPHNLHDTLFDACGWYRLVFSTPTELEATLREQLHMGSKRGVWAPPLQSSPTTERSVLEQGGGGVDLGPHLVIVDDNTGSDEAWESVIGQVGKQGITLLRVASRVGSGVGFGAGQVFEVSAPDRDGAAKHRRVGNSERGGARPLLRHGGKFFAHADQLPTPRAYRYARAMARWSPADAPEESDSGVGAAELMRSLGISDPRELDVDRLWAGRQGRGDDEWGVIPVGTKPNGALQSIIFRAKDFGGFGFHSVVIGTSGSGKSEFFLSLVLGLALTHSPETFNVIFVDMKFESAAQDLQGIPHVTAALSNLGKDERHLADRMLRVVDGEIKQRYAAFKAVGARDANEYEEIRRAGRDLPPIPVLLLIVDEYLELFQKHPEWVELIIHIGQEGRGANVFFMLGAQRLDLSSLGKVKTNIAFRICLRMESGDESREVIGNEAALHLPSKENGFALLKVGPRDLDPFRCFYLSAPFVVPKTKRVAKTIDMTLTKPRLYNEVHQPLDEQDVAVLEAAAEAVEEPDEFLYVDEQKTKKKKIIDVARESLVASGRVSPRRPWLEPLEVSERVDTLVAQYRGKAWHVDYGQNRGLVFPFAMVDIPEESKQHVHVLDVLRENVIVVGAKGKGKTTTLMTLMCSAALMYTPARVTFFCVGSSLAKLESWPHVAGVVSPNDTEGVVRTISTMEARVNSREDAFRLAAIDIDDFREQRFGTGSDGIGGTDPNDRYGDVFLVLDDFSELYKRDNLLGDRIIALSSRGPEYGVHVMVSAPGWVTEQKQALLQNAGARIELRLREPNETKMGQGSLEARKAAGRTLDRPGFGLTQSLHEMLIGEPKIVDGNNQVVDTRNVGLLVAQVVGDDQVSRGQQLQRLPERVALRKILDLVPERRDEQDLSFAFAIGELHNLGPVPVSLRDNSGMAIVGRSQCGRSTALVAIGEAIAERFGPGEAQLTLIDPKTGPLQQLHAPDHVRAYAYDQDEINEVIKGLVEQILLPRIPPTGLTQQELRDRKPWEGPRHFVLIDDVHELRGQYGAQPAVGSLLWKLMQRRDIGLHVFTTRNSSNWGSLDMDQWMKFQRMANAPFLYMDNDSRNKIGRVLRAQSLPPGRGLLVTDDANAEGVLVGLPSTAADD